MAVINRARELTYISANVPLAIASHVHGICQRQQLFIDALSPLFDRIHCIFWKGLGPDGGLDAAEVSRRAAKAFGKPVRVSILQPARREANPGYGDFYLKSIFLGPMALGHRRVIGAQEVAQLQACIDDDTGPVFAQGLEAMSTVARLPRSPPLTLWDLNDLESLKFLRGLRRGPRGLGKPLMYLQGLGLLAQERKAARAATLGFVCSDIDQRRAESFMGGKFHAVPNAVMVPHAPLPLQEGSPTLLFVGFFGYEPNCDAADWFIASIWPRILAEAPHARLLVAGALPERLKAHGRLPQGVQLLGFVPDLEPVYAGAHVVVCPVRSGSGTRVKLLEAAAYARPIVSTTVGAEGIDFEHSRSVMLCDDPIAFAKACVALLADRARADEMGRSAWQLARSRYSREAVIEQIRKHVLLARAEVSPTA